jgi:hypothetical protein
MHTALPTPIAASLAVDTVALLTPSRQGALEVVTVRLGANIRII